MVFVSASRQEGGRFTEGTFYLLKDRMYIHNTHYISLSNRMIYSWEISPLSGCYATTWRHQVGPPGSCTKEQGRNERETATCDRRYTGTRPSDTEETNRHRHRETRTNKYIYNNEMTISRQQPTMGHRSVTTEQAGE